MYLGNQYSSLTRIVLQNIRDDEKICAHNYSDTVVYFERFCVVCPWTFSENILCQTFVGYKSKFLKKMDLNLRTWNFQHLRNQQNQGRYPYGTYL